MVPAPNALHHGDNLEVLRRQVADATVDLVYLDPPFNSNGSYGGVFEDRWRWDGPAAAAYEQASAAATSAAEALIGLRSLIGETPALAYLTMMAPRLQELHRALKATGTLVLHCDPSASHHLRLLLDAIFGADGFRNEVIWHYGGRGAKAVSGQFPRNHDVLLWYSKGSRWFYERQHSERLLDERQARQAGYRCDERGRWFRTAPRGDYSDRSIERLRAEGRIHDTSSGAIRVKYFMPTRGPKVVEQRLLGDVWNDIPDAMHMPHAERLGYPTQKPLALVERVIAAACPPGGMVLDPFCGSGTTLAAAARLGRSWVGIDLSEHAVEVSRARLAALEGTTLEPAGTRGSVVERAVAAE